MTEQRTGQRALQKRAADQDTCTCGKAKSRRAHRCQACDRAERRQTRDRFHDGIIALRRLGATNRQIACQLNVPSQAIDSAFYLARQAGKDVPPSPYRDRTHQP